MSKTDSTYHQSESGMTLVEVLITLIILSIGIFGIAGLQIVGLHSSNSAVYTSLATNLANDIVEMMRTNEEAIDNGLYSAVSKATINCNALPDPYCADRYNGSTIVAGTTECTPEEMANFDINIWYCGTPYSATASERMNGVSTLLPNITDATIICTDSDTTDGNACSINSNRIVTITWTEVNPDRQSTSGDISRTIQVTMLQ